MKTTEWFICLAYERYSFLIPHSYNIVNGSIPDIFIDFDKLAKDMFSVENSEKHPAAITVKCTKTAMLSTSAIPTIHQADLREFYIPSGIIEEHSKEIGIIAISFSPKGISVIINPELLYEEWSKEK